MTTLKIPAGGVSIPGSDYPGGAEIVETNEEIIELLKAAGATKVDRKSTRLNSSHIQKSRMPSSA